MAAYKPFVILPNHLSFLTEPPTCTIANNICLRYCGWPTFGFGSGFWGNAESRRSREEWQVTLAAGAKTSMGTAVRRVLVTGAGGFIGHHLVTFLREQGYWVRGADLKHPQFAASNADEFHVADLRRWDDCLFATEGIDEVYALAADMGGMGFISCNHAQILHNNSLINIHSIEAARQNGVKRYLFTSSACVYPEFKQTDAACVPLKEEDAYPADPQDAYGWEKLVSERLCTHYHEDYGLETRTVRFHNIFGPYGTWEGGREKAPAALCRKVAMAKRYGTKEIEIWGDGEQTRSFCYITDCITGLVKLMRSDYRHPLNLGQDRMVSINELADLIANVAGMSIVRKHVNGPQGVRGRNSDNKRLRQVLGWEPQVSLEYGLASTYEWIEGEVRKATASLAAIA
jgi:GDP-D-mannose 3',5'-epimerase